MRRARWVGLALIVGTCVGLGSQLPRLELALAPETLVDVPELEATPTRLVLIVVAAEPLALDALRHVHAASRAMRQRSEVLTVDSLTVTPLPHAAGSRRGLTLANLEGEVDPDPGIEEALGRVLATDPTRFPLGLASLQPAIEWGPLVRGAQVVEADRRRIEDALEQVPELRGRLIDDAGRHLVVAVTLRPSLGPRAVRDASLALAQWTEAHPAPRGGAQHVVGLPIIRASMLAELRQDQVRLPFFAVLASGLVLLIAFRSWAGVLLPMSAAGLACAATIGAMAALGQPVDLLTNVIPALLITLGLGDAVHLTVRYRQELRRRAAREAADVTFRRMVVACLSTSLTTAVGFLSLATSGSRILMGFGAIASAGVLVAYVVTVGVLPATLAEVGLEPEEGDGRLERALSRIARSSRKSSRVVIGSAVSLLLIAAAIGVNVSRDAALRDQLDQGSPTVAALRSMEDRFGGYRVMDVAIEGTATSFRTAEGVAELEAIEAWLAAQPLVGRVDGPAARLAATWRVLTGSDEGAYASDARVDALLALGGLGGTSVELENLDDSVLYSYSAEASPDAHRRRGSRELVIETVPRQRAHVTVHLRDVSEHRITELADAIEARFPAAEVGGEATRTARGLGRLFAQLAFSLTLAVVLTFFVLGALLRSARLALVSVLPNVLPLAIALAWMALRGLPLHASTAIVFTISIGLAVDGTIHVLSRYREALATSDDPIDIAVRGSGRAVTIGVLTLLAGFAALTFAGSVPIRQFAEIGAVAIASSWVCELIVLPALLERFGGR